MKLILIDGGPASGKNTLGTLLVEMLQRDGINGILFDLDTYVEKRNPSWIWKNKSIEKRDQLKAREDFTADIRKFLRRKYTVIGIGERLLTRDDVTSFLNRIHISCPVYLYHLHVPLTVRRKRLVERGPHSLIDLDKDQRERDAVASWPGYVYENLSSPEIDASHLLQLIRESKGIIKTVEK